MLLSEFAEPALWMGGQILSGRSKSALFSAKLGYFGPQKATELRHGCGGVHTGPCGKVDDGSLSPVRS